MATEEIVEEAWSNFFQGSPPYVLVSKIKCAREALRRWNKDEVGSLKDTKNRIEELLKYLQQNSHIPGVLSQEQPVRADLIKVLEQEQIV